MDESLSRFHQLLVAKGIAFVRYCLPEESEARTFVSYNPYSYSDLNYLVDNQEEGFVFAPFIIDKKCPVWFLRADETIEDTTDILFIENHLQTLPDANQKTDQNLEATSKSDYSKAFDTFLNELKSSNLDKAILSRIVTKPRNHESLISVFTRLAKTYSDAFCYLVHLPSGETWMGASPELLLRQEEKSLHTMALAGTQLLNNRSLNEVIWENKEIEEQAYVREYVKNVLTSIDETIDISDTYSAKAGNLVHLRTDFALGQSFDRLKVIDIVKKLHPTPAVCGIPLEESKALIQNTEQHSRAYYTGFLGSVNSRSMALFVNLRCMQVLSDNYALYVGGGITRDSEMENEWNETEAKAQTLLSVINTPTI